MSGGFALHAELEEGTVDCNCIDSHWNQVGKVEKGVQLQWVYFCTFPSTCHCSSEIIPEMDIQYRNVAVVNATSALVT